MRELEVVKPKWAWFTLFGKEWPKGLRVLETNKDLAALWKDAEHHNRLVIVVYMQDSIAEETSGEDGISELSYVLPAGIPYLRLDYDGDLAELYANEWDAKIKATCTPGMIEMLENRCDRWYSSAIAYPRGPVRMRF